MRSLPHKSSTGLKAAMRERDSRGIEAEREHVA